MKENLEAAKELLKKYKSITLEEITKCYNNLKTVRKSVNGYHVMNHLTGFGMCNTCYLCQVVNSDCDVCVYSARSVYDYPCIDDSYRVLSHAKTPENIFFGLENRIKYLEETIMLCEKYL